jgi:hypothetical protein
MQTTNPTFERRMRNADRHMECAARFSEHARAARTDAAAAQWRANARFELERARYWYALAGKGAR